MTKADATRQIATILVHDLRRVGESEITSATVNAALNELRRTAPASSPARAALDAFGEDVTTWRWRELKREMRAAMRTRLEYERPA
ncbi:hypothetical protein P3T35_003141 [Kitasatospora sp. GP30]|uniref:hypothetical protein n=1 Tax=Kitasatospora sp. GP30 TaxID=3035084 RepID=UPI000C70C3EB|nr:hypothetical protein [Kitasatospora sp. GP30]MDH6141128.1 hypothetical protein [Kitasatospora sp. GP30]